MTTTPPIPYEPTTSPDIAVVAAGSAHERMERAIVDAAAAFQALCALAHAMARALDENAATREQQP